MKEVRIIICRTCFRITVSMTLIINSIIDFAQLRCSPRTCAHTLFVNADANSAVMSEKNNVILTALVNGSLIEIN